MGCTTTVLTGFDKRVRQPGSRTRPCIDWAIEICGEPAGVVVVRTYFSSNPPQQEERCELERKAVEFVKRKLNEGWMPWPGVMECEEDIKLGESRPAKD